MITFLRSHFSSPLRLIASDLFRTTPTTGLAADFSSDPRAAVCAYKNTYTLWRALDLGAMWSQNGVEIRKLLTA